MFVYGLLGLKNRVFYIGSSNLMGLPEALCRKSDPASRNPKLPMPERVKSIRGASQARACSRGPAGGQQRPLPSPSAVVEFGATRFLQGF